METELVYVQLDDDRHRALILSSIATGKSVEELIQAAVAEFLAERRSE
jgi:hypothetical protein